MNYSGSPRTMAFPVPSLNQGASIYPAALLDEQGVNLDLWVASGVIHAIHFNSGTALIPVIEIYDFVDKTTGRPLSDGGTYKTGGGTNVVGLVGGLQQIGDTDPGDAQAEPTFEVFNGIAAADGTNAFVINNAKRVWRWGPQTAIEISLEHIEAVCVHGMVIQLIGTVTAAVELSVTYTPWALGAHRRKISTKVGVGGSFTTEQLPVA